MKPLYLKKVLKYNYIEMRMLVIGFFYSFFAFIIVNCLPFRFYKSLLYKKKCEINHPSHKENMVLLTKKTIKRIRKISFWNNTCLIQAITMKFLLNNFDIDSRIILSLSKNNNTLMAHASLKINEHMEPYKRLNFHAVYTI